MRKKRGKCLVEKRRMNVGALFSVFGLALLDHAVLLFPTWVIWIEK